MNYYEKEPVSKLQKDHELSVKNRRDIEITGVKDVDSFDNEAFLLETVMGYIYVRGENLQLKNLDLASGLVSIKGKVYELAYVDDDGQGKTKGLFSKWFK